MSARDFYGLGNEAFMKENFEEALKLYKSGAESNEKVESCHVGAAQVLMKEDRFTEALHHVNKALEINPNNDEAHFRKGIALFNLGKLSEAKTSFEEVLKIKGHDVRLETWLSKCEESSDDKVESLDISSDKSAQRDIVPIHQPKYDWYQSESDVIVSVLVKDVRAEDITYEINSNNLNVMINHRNGSKFHLKIHTLHDVVPEESKLKILSTRIEIKLRKSNGIRWEKLEFQNTHEACDRGKSGDDTSKLKKDWDKLVSEVKDEEKNEEAQGEAALNRLFQQIYADGSDEVKKAMIKSYTESAGTVLSTNWGDIGKRNVEVQPPECMEFKKWNE